MGPKARVMVLLWITSLCLPAACTASRTAGPTAPVQDTATPNAVAVTTTSTAVATYQGSGAASATPWVPLVDLGAVGKDGTPGVANAAHLSQTPKHCPQPWFFTPGPTFCPDGPAEALTVAEQPFERGRMVWVPEEGGAQVYVMYSDGKAEGWADDWVEGQPETDPDIVPPAGLLQPRRGFGAAWRRVTGLRDRLGWAVAPESAAETLVQRERFGVDVKGWNIFVRLADERVVQFVGHYATYAWREAGR